VDQFCDVHSLGYHGIHGFAMGSPVDVPHDELRPMVIQGWACRVASQFFDDFGGDGPVWYGNEGSSVG
jgi:hypothetical protein